MVTMNNMAVVIQRKKSTNTSQYDVTHYSWKDIRETLEDHWIPKDVSEESAEYLFLSCAEARTIVTHGMWSVLARIVSGTTTSL